MCGIRRGREPTGSPLLRGLLSPPGGWEVWRIVGIPGTKVEGLGSLRLLFGTVIWEAVVVAVGVTSSLPNV